MRKKIVAGNWKMNFTPAEAASFAANMKDKLNTNAVDVVLCVPYVSLQTVQEKLAGTHIKIGAQNMHQAEKGAFTGEISGEMLQSMGIPYVIVGHSERREYFNETDKTVNLKTKKALALNITPIVCVGESLDERNDGKTEDILRKQVPAALDGLTAEDISNTVIAYEPIWAIGTGLTATNEQAEHACKFIRDLVANLYNEETAAKVRILYGGSVSAKNAGELFAMPNIDGGLVGGASITPDFEKVVHF